MPQVTDHLLVAGFVIGLPVTALTIWYPLIQRSHAQGRPNVFIYAIGAGVVVQWLLVAAVFSIWRETGRSIEVLGFARPDGISFWISFAVFAGALFFLIAQHVSVLQSEENRQALMQQFTRLRPLLPDTEGKVSVFMLASVTAGFCEELLYRGYLTWYLSAFMPTWAAYGVGTLAFGLGHAYQGRKGIVQTTVMGAIFMVFVHFSGSLWLAMILHAAVDINSGLLGYKLLRAAPDEVDE